MPYRGPQVIPRGRTSGDPWANALSTGFESFTATREADRQRQRQEDADARAIASHEAGLSAAELALADGEAGFYERGGRTGAMPRATEITDPAGDVRMVPPHAQDLGGGRYLDLNETPSAVATRTAATKTATAEAAMRSFYEGAPDWFRSEVGDYAPGTDYRGMYDDVLREHGDTADRDATKTRTDADRAATGKRYDADRSSREREGSANRSSAQGIAATREKGLDRRSTAAAGTKGLTAQQALTFGMNAQDGSEVGPDPALARQMADSVQAGGALPSRDPNTGALVWPPPKPQEVARPTYGEVLQDAMKTPLQNIGAPANAPANAPPSAPAAAAAIAPPVAPPNVNPGDASSGAAAVTATPTPAAPKPKPGEAGAKGAPPPQPITGGGMKDVFKAKEPMSDATKARAMANPQLKAALIAKYGYSEADFVRQ